MLSWLFRRPVNRERAIVIAMEFLRANGCRVVATEAEVDWAGDDLPLLLQSVSKPGRRWYVEFEQVLPPGVMMTSHGTTVYVWADTGHATFDHFEGW